MLHSESNLFDRIEPVELFLRDHICPDKLALYQPIIDLFKTNEMITVLNAINSLLTVVGDQSVSETIDEIDSTINKYLIQCLQDFEIITDGDLCFLYKLYRALSMLDTIEDHRTVVNICDDNTLSPIDKLFHAVSLVDNFDELEFMDSVHLVSLSFIVRLKETHAAPMDAMEDVNEVVVQEPKHVQLIRSLYSKYPKLYCFELLNSHIVKLGANPLTLVDLANGFFDDFSRLDTQETIREIALEIVGLFLISTIDLEQLKKVIMDNIPKLLSDEELVYRVQSLISTVIAEVMSNG